MHTRQGSIGLRAGFTLRGGHSIGGGARTSAQLHGFTDLVGACADDVDRDYLRAATRVTDTGAVQVTGGLAYFPAPTRKPDPSSDFSNTA